MNKIRRVYNILISKIINTVAKEMTNFFAEIGDVENLIQQMKFWFAESGCEELVKQFRIEKLDRLAERVKGEI